MFKYKQYSLLRIKFARGITVENLHCVNLVWTEFLKREIERGSD
jgi:hypothetical protein